MPADRMISSMLERIRSLPTPVRRRKATAAEIRKIKALASGTSQGAYRQIASDLTVYPLWDAVQMWYGEGGFPGEIPRRVLASLVLILEKDETRKERPPRERKPRKKSGPKAPRRTIQVPISYPSTGEAGEIELKVTVVGPGIGVNLAPEKTDQYNVTHLVTGACFITGLSRPDAFRIARKISARFGVVLETLRTPGHVVDYPGMQGFMREVFNEQRALEKKRRGW